MSEMNKKISKIHTFTLYFMFGREEKKWENKILKFKLEKKWKEKQI